MAVRDAGLARRGRPEFKAFFPTDVLSTARDIIFLWVARMIMTSLEFTGEVPFSDVYIHSVIQAPDGRRMSKSLGTGIDPLDEIESHGADALRFGLLAMSSAQDVRYSEARVQQGRDLANKMWNASRLILMNAADDVEPGAGRDRVEDRWIASRLQRAIASVTESVEAYDFSHAVLDLYEFFWSELCDWYLEIVKERLYDGDEDASATLLWALEQVLALAHPFMPFVTEEVYSYLPGDESEALVIHPFPEADESLVDAEAEAEIGAAIELTRGLRRWRDLAGVPAGQVLAARAPNGQPHELVARLARVEFGADEGEPIATVGGVELLETEGIDAEAVAPGSRSAARSCAPRSSAARGSSPTRASSPRPRPTSSTRSARSSRRTGPSWRSWADRSRGARAPGVPRLAAGAGADAAALLAARHAPEPLRLDPRRRHQRQDLGGPDDRGAARGARGARPAPTSRPTSTPGASGS